MMKESHDQFLELLFCTLSATKSGGTQVRNRRYPKCTSASVVILTFSTLLVFVLNFFCPFCSLQLCVREVL